MKFIKMPSGVIINMTYVEHITGVNEIKQPYAKKSSSFMFSIQYQGRNTPTTFSYLTREEAEADYSSLCTICD